MSRFLTETLKELDPYIPGEQPRNRRFIKLNTNESPFPPSPRVLEAISLQAQDLNLYPDPTCFDLIGSLANHYQVDRQQVIVGNGSDELLAFSFQAFCGKGVCFPSISYGFYPVFARLYGIDAQEIPLKADFSIDPADYREAGRTIVIANPNAPTGLYLEPKDIRAILDSNPQDLVIVDEAYIDFGGVSSVDLLSQYDNLLIIGTFSKSRSLAGGRVGYAIGSPAIIDDLNRIRFSFNPYNLNRVSLAAATAALEDTSYFESCTQMIMTTRQRTKDTLMKMGFDATDSYANFLFVSHPGLTGSKYYNDLKERGILVRYFDKEGLRNYVRITIGSNTDMNILIDTTEEILREVK